MIGQESLALESALAARQFGVIDLSGDRILESGAQPLSLTPPNAQRRPGPPPPPAPPPASAFGPADVELNPTSSAVSVEPPRTSNEPVAVETRTVPVRGGRHQAPEHYPFGALEPVSLDAKGRHVGSCFFIPDEDDPKRLLAAARKRHRPKVFITRTDRQRGGRWVWRES